MADDDVTHWISQLAQGDGLAIQDVWGRYYEKLVLIARKRIGDRVLPAADEEDVALSDGDQVHFAINGENVATHPVSALSTDGIVGLRLNHGVNVHVSDLRVE